MELLLTKNLIRKFVGSTFFSVEFTKKNGEKRKMLCRLDVKKHLKGGAKLYDKDNLMTVFDVLKREYRTINLSTVNSLKFKGNNIKL